MLRKDFRTDTWDRLKEHVVARLSALDKENRSLNLGPEKTAAVRGRISELEKLLALETAPAKGVRAAMPPELEPPDEGND